MTRELETVFSIQIRKAGTIVGFSGEAYDPEVALTTAQKLAAEWQIKTICQGYPSGTADAVFITSTQRPKALTFNEWKESNRRELARERSPRAWYPGRESIPSNDGYGGGGEQPLTVGTQPAASTQLQAEAHQNAPREIRVAQKLPLGELPLKDFIAPLPRKV